MYAKAVASTSLQAEAGRSRRIWMVFVSLRLQSKPSRAHVIRRMQHGVTKTDFCLNASSSQRQYRKLLRVCRAAAGSYHEEEEEEEEEELNVNGSSSSTTTTTTTTTTIPSSSSNSKEDDLLVSKRDRGGTVMGAASLIIGTTIGSGILALPQKTSPAGFIPSAATVIVCWGFLLGEALLLAEVNVSLRLKRKKRSKDGAVVEVISFKTMAQETLGDWGGKVATFTYVFLAYTSMVAYASKSGDLLSHLITLPSPILAAFFTSLLAAIIFFGGTPLTDHVNRWLTALMIGLLVLIEAMATSSSHGGWSGLVATDDWSRIPSTVPVIIFSLVYHDIAPVICSYLDDDMKRIRSSLIIGSLVPMLSLLAWDAIMLGFTDQAGGITGGDPLDLMMMGRGAWNGAWPAVEAFSLLAVGTSLIGTLLGFSHFFQELLIAKLSTPQPAQEFPPSPTRQIDMVRIWWEDSKLSLTAISIAVVPPLLLSATVPDAFSVATDIAGGYCMTILYGLLPPAMAWVMQSASIGDPIKDDEGKEDIQAQAGLSKDKSALIAMGIFAFVLVIQQVLQDLSGLHL